jgi:hypothetical protein
MEFVDNIMEKWESFCEKARPTVKVIKAYAREVMKVFGRMWDFVTRLRKVFLAVPVAWGAVMLALYNLKHLPAVVGLDLQIGGDYSIQVVRELAVLGPVAVTAVCLLLMFISRRTLTPWIVSLFSLVLPLVILVTNIFPA